MLQLLCDCTALSKLAQVERFKLKTIHQCLLNGRAQYYAYSRIPVKS